MEIKRNIIDALKVWKNAPRRKPLVLQGVHVKWVSHGH